MDLRLPLAAACLGLASGIVAWQRRARTCRRHSRLAGALGAAAVALLVGGGA